MRNQIKGPKFGGFSRTFLVLAAVTGLWHWTNAEASPGKSIRGEPGSAVRSAEINASELGREKRSSTKVKAPKAIRPMTRRSAPMRAPSLKRSSTTRQTAPAASQTLTAQAGTTPPASASFPGLLDNGAVYYPDGQGAVGQNHLMVASDSEIRFQDRNGGVLQTIATDAFWSPAGVNNVYDVRLVYDPYGARWVMAAESSPPGGPYRLLMGVSDTSDPMGDWSLYTVDVGAGSTRYPDGVNLGFTKDWITVQTDLRDTTSYFFESSEIFVFDKAWAYAGNATANFTRFTLLAADDVNAQVPAVTFSTTADRQYLMTVWNGNDGDPVEPYGWLAVYYIEGAVGQETLTLPDANSLDGWVYLDRPWEDYATSANFLPQAGATNKIYPGDSRLQGLIYRNGSLWTTHTIFLPTNGATRAAVQYWEVLPNGGAPIQNGRVEDANNFYHYAFPSIAVNRKNEVLLGYSRFSTDSYPGGYYSYHSELDVFSSLRPVSQLVGGEAPFAREDPGGTTYWGRYNSGAIDPVNDTDLWTLQQYAAQPQGTAGRWGLWWARVTPPVDLAVQITETPDPVLAGGLVTYSVLVTNTRIAYIDDVVLTNALPAGTTFASATVSQGTWNYANGEVVCNFGSLGDRGFATLTLQVTPLAVGQITNRAVAWARGPEAVARQQRCDGGDNGEPERGPGADGGTQRGGGDRVEYFGFHGADCECRSIHGDGRVRD